MLKCKVQAKGLKKTERKRFYENCRKSVYYHRYGRGLLVYSSSDHRVATVDSEGTITAVGKGRAIVTVCTEDGQNVEICRMYVDTEKQTDAEDLPKVHFYQGDPEWRFSYGVRRKACALTSMTMLLKNSGIDTNPAEAFENNGRNTGMIYKKLLKSYGKQYDCAVPYDSAYLLNYSSADGKTTIMNPERYYESAVREALVLMCTYGMNIPPVLNQYSIVPS